MMEQYFTLTTVVRILILLHRFDSDLRQLKHRVEGYISSNSRRQWERTIEMLHVVNLKTAGDPYVADSKEWLVVRKTQTTISTASFWYHTAPRVLRMRIGVFTLFLDHLDVHMDNKSSRTPWETRFRSAGSSSRRVVITIYQCSNTPQIRSNRNVSDLTGSMISKQCCSVSVSRTVLHPRLATGQTWPNAIRALELFK